VRTVVETGRTNRIADGATEAAEPGEGDEPAERENRLRVPGTDAGHPQPVRLPWAGIRRDRP